MLKRSIAFGSVRRRCICMRITGTCYERDGPDLVCRRGAVVNRMSRNLRQHGLGHSNAELSRCECETCKTWQQIRRHFSRQQARGDSDISARRQSGFVKPAICGNSHTVALKQISRWCVSRRKQRPGCVVPAAFAELTVFD